MGQRLTQYDHELRKRLEVARKKQKITQVQMAECMGVSIERYKRFIYGKSKIPIEDIAHLFENLPVDWDYLLLGKDRNALRTVGYLMGSNDLEKAELCMELSRLLRRKHYQDTVDYMTDDGNLIETDNRNEKNK